MYENQAADGKSFSFADTCPGATQRLCEHVWDAAIAARESETPEGWGCELHRVILAMGLCIYCRAS